MNSYGWVDQRLRVVRIPVDQAMDLVLKNGLPVRVTAARPGAAAVNVPPRDGRRAAPILRGRARILRSPRK